MRKSFFILLLLCLALTSRAADTLIVPSAIEGVTVFLNRAQVFRSADFRLGAGQYEIVLEGLSAQIEPNSLQVHGRGSFTILEARHHVHYPEPPGTTADPLPPRIRKQIALLEDSLKDHGYALELIRSRKNGLDLEKNMLLTNPIMTGDRGSDTIPVLKDAMLFFRAKLEDIHRELLKAKREEDRLVAEQSRMNTRLAQLRQYRAHLGTKKHSGPVQQIRVTVLAKKAASGRLELSYMVGGASWSPSYDIRSAGIGRPVDLTYKARVRQQTGVDWKGVELTLSTNDPNRSQRKPELPVWFIDYYKAVHQRVLTGDLLEVPSLAYESVEEDANFDAKMASDYVQMTSSFGNVEFEIDLNYDIPSDGREHLILVKEDQLAADYRHYLVPKLDRESFVAARIGGWEELNLLPALANIFYDGTYIGQAHVDPQTFGDTLDLPMGRDRLVYAERERVDKDEKVKTLGGDRVRTERWKIEVRNNHAMTVDLILQDQHPVAADPDIDIDLVDTEVDRHEEQLGLLEWRIALPAKTTIERQFGWKIKWDKDRDLTLQ